MTGEIVDIDEGDSILLTAKDEQQPAV